jgi:putative flippase GtrA
MASSVHTNAGDVRKSFRFALVGAATAIIYFGLLATLMRYAGLNYRWAVTAAYIAGVSFHFAANRRYTFEAHGQPLAPQAVRYVVLIVINYIVMLAVVTGLVEIFGVVPPVAVCVAVAVTTGTGFLLARFWVFRLG